MKKLILIFLMLFSFSNLTLSQTEIKYFSAAPWVPFLLKDNFNNFTGLAMDLTEEIGKRLGVKTKLIDVPWARGFSMLENGTMDMCPSAYLNEERIKKFIFTEPFMKNETRIFVRKDSQFKFESFEDLKGKILGKSLNASFGDNFDNFAKEYLQISQNITGKVGLFQMLEFKRVDGVLMDYNDGMAYIKANGIKNITVLEKPVNSVDVFIVISKESWLKYKLKEINEIIVELRDSGQINEMAQKYF